MTDDTEGKLAGWLASAAIGIIMAVLIFATGGPLWAMIGFGLLTFWLMASKAPR